MSTHTARGESEARDLYQAITLRLTQLRVSEGRALRDVLKQVTDTVANALQVQRVSVWFFVDEQRTIRCDYLYEKDHGDIYEGAILHACDFPEYFKALTSRRVVRFVDCAGDPMSEELRNSYLGPLGITAMLDAPLYQHGEVVGIVCHEHLGHPREWTDPESEFVASVGDIVARIYVEAAQLRAQDQLRIQDTRLAELQQLAELGRLATGVAHDINNVLGAVFSYVDLVTAAAAENGEVNRLGTELSAIVERGRELTQTLLMLGRANSERPRVISPPDVLNSSLALLRGAAGPRVRVQTSIAANISRVLIDPLQLERAVLNLVVNARDAMPLGGVITVELREETIGLTAEHQSTFVVLEVIDTGTGMDSATRDHMFETYFTTKGAKGKGLGLAIVNQVVTLAGGFIQADSTPGQGTRVRLYLPRIAADESVAT